MTDPTPAIRAFSESDEDLHQLAGRRIAIIGSGT